MSDLKQNRGRVTIPTDVDVVPETLELLERWGADAIRDCDGTDYPEQLKSVDAKVYSCLPLIHISSAETPGSSESIFTLRAYSRGDMPVTLRKRREK